MALAIARRFAMQSLRASGQKRGMAGGKYDVPPPDTSMDHVFGDNSAKLPFDFSAPNPLSTFFAFCTMVGILGTPVWIAMYEDNKMDRFLEKLETARAAKSASTTADS